MDVQQRIARLEGLLARVLQRRGQARAAAAPENGMSAGAPPAPSPAPPEAVQDDVVDLLDDDIVEIRESAAPPPARPEPPPPPPRIAPMVLEQLPGDAEAYSGAAATSAVAHEPEPSPPPPAERTPWPSSIPPRAAEAEMSFGDSEAPAPVQAQRPGFGLDFDDEEEEPPASSRRAIASSMDEALADAAAREVPLQTPPPESGPQEALILPKGAALPEPDIDEAPPGAAEASQLAEGLPTSAQLGNTVSLEEGGAVDFEVEVPVESGLKESAPPPSEDFEIRLPQREAAGTYDSNLAPPPEAQSELEAHRERAHAAAIAEAALEARDVVGDAPPDETETFERAALPNIPVTSVTGAPQRFRPGSFLELLDASLKLGKD